MFALAVVGVSLWGCGGSNSGGSATGDQGQRQRGNQPAEPEVSVDDFLIPIDTPGEWVTTEANYESPDAVWQEVMQFEKDNDMAGLLELTAWESRRDYLPILLGLLDDVPRFDRSRADDVDTLIAQHFGSAFDLEAYVVFLEALDEADWDALVALGKRTAVMLSDPDAFMAEAMVLYNEASENTDREYELGGLRNIEIDEDYAEADFQAIFGGDIRFFELELVDFIRDDNGWLMILGGAW